MDVVFQDGTLRQFSASGVQVLGGPVLSAGVAFSPTLGLVQDVVFQDGSLFQFDVFGARLLGKLF
jgi:hypothetical protein